MTRTPVDSIRSSRGTRALRVALPVAAVVTLALPAAARAQTTAAQAAPQAAARVEPLVVNFRDVAWGPPGSTPRFPAGVQTAQLGTDPTNGGPTYLARFPAGSHFDLHWHTHTEYVVVMSGAVTIELGDETHALVPGEYVVIPGSMHHSWDVPPGEAVVILVRRAGPADFNFVDASP